MSAESLLHCHVDWTLSLCAVTLVNSRRMKSSFLLIMINSAWQNNTWRPIHAFIYSVGIDWTNIFLPEVIHSSALLCFNSADVIHHPYCGLLSYMSAANQHSFIVLSLCYREPQELIFSAGCVEKPLAAAVLRVSFHSHWSWMDKEPWAGVDSCASVNLQQHPKVSLTSESEAAKGETYILQPTTHSAGALCAIKMHQVQITCWFTVELGDRGLASSAVPRIRMGPD